MDTEDSDSSSGEIAGEVRRRIKRKRRSLWKRRQFWISLLAVIVGILMVLWMISSLSSHRSEME